jgi:hypothetical protein
MLIWNNANIVASTIWAIVETIAIIAAGLFAVNKMLKRIERRFDVQDAQLIKINYALFNEGKTGLINKVDSLVDKQQEIKTDVAIIKSKQGR